MALILGIESSCDETAVAVIDGAGTTLAARIVAQRIASQDDEHRPYGGVVPEIAARAHAETLAPMVGAVLIASVLRGAPDFSFLHARFGLMYLFTALVGWGAALSPAAAPGAASAGTAPTP